MDFTLTPEIEDIRLRTRAFVEAHVLPLEAQRENYDQHENIRDDVLALVRQSRWVKAGRKMGLGPELNG